MHPQSQQPYKAQFTQFSQHYLCKNQAYFDFADKLYRQGLFESAIWYLHVLVKQQSKMVNINTYSRMASCYFAIKDFQQALHWMLQAQTLAPNNDKLLSNLGSLYSRLNNYDKAIAILQQCLTLNPENLSALDVLAAIYGNLSDHKKAKYFGTLSLQIKQRQALSAENLAKLQLIWGDLPHIHQPVSAFDGNKPEQNIIAYSLFGQDPYYHQGAILNAKTAPFIYPGWTCRFYCDDSLPDTVINTLRKHRAQIVMMPPEPRAYQGLFWRFYVIEDPNVMRYLIRDVDSLSTCEERIAVDEWLASQQPFHIIRDAYSHCELILAGLWGGTKSAMTQIKPAISRYLENIPPERSNDQLFLRHCLWPIIKDHLFTHDNKFYFHGGKDFSSLGKNPYHDQHVGQNYKAMLNLSLDKGDPI